MKYSNASSKVKTMKEEIVGVHSLACSTLGVDVRAKDLGWGLGRVISKSIIHMDLHNLDNKLVNARLEHFWCTDES